MDKPRCITCGRALFDAGARMRLGVRTCASCSAKSLARTGGEQEAATEELQVWRRSEKVDVLKKVPLFNDLSQRHLGRIATLASERQKDAGITLARQGAPGLEFFLILEGIARVERDGRLLARLGTGDCFGEMSLIDFGLRSATVTAETPIVLMVIHTRSFQRLLYDVPALQRKLLVTLSERLREANAALASVN